MGPCVTLAEQLACHCTGSPSHCQLQWVPREGSQRVPGDIMCHASTKGGPWLMVVVQVGG